MRPAPDKLNVRLARGAADLHAAQRLRYEVFVAELGGDGPMVDHAARLERDRFDPHFEHLLLVDETRPEGENALGAYRLMRGARAAAGIGFYSAGEYDLAPLHASGRELLELGRSCVAAELRGTDAMFLLWRGLAAYVAEHGVEILFGVASFHGTDTAALAQPLSFLHHRHLAPRALRVRSRAHAPMDLVPPEAIDRRAAVAALPALIKAYLRVGGHVGDGAFVDRPFNTVDVCLVMDAGRMPAPARAVYGP